MEGSGRHVFVTGRAGTGKSTLLNYFCERTGKAVVVLAPTGVAAINVGGQTIHSFFRFKPDVIPSAIKRRSGDEKKNIYKKLKTILIDEVSMVRADLLDCVDKFLRMNGPDETFTLRRRADDLYRRSLSVAAVRQQPRPGDFPDPLRHPLLFQRPGLRRPDIAFRGAGEKSTASRTASSFRLLIPSATATVTDDDLALFNQRHDPNFTAPPGDFYIHLTSTEQPGRRQSMRSSFSGLPGRSGNSRGSLKGNFGREYLPTALDLKLRKNAQIMMLNNDSYGRWVNGTIGRVTGFKKDKAGETLIQAKLDNGEKVEIAPKHLGDLPVFPEGGRTGLGGGGAFTQYPVRLAFAVTIHKSQGKTFEKAIIDVGRGTFAHGQMYVALSRCTTLDGMS